MFRPPDPCKRRLRYVADEVHCLFDNSDAAVVVYGKEFRDNMALLRPHLPKLALD